MGVERVEGGFNENFNLKDFEKLVVEKFELYLSGLSWDGRKNGAIFG